MKLSFSIAFTIHTHTYRRINPKVIEGYKRRKLKDNYLDFTSWFGFEGEATRKRNQKAARPLGKGRGLDYEQSPT